MKIMARKTLSLGYIGLAVPVTMVAVSLLCEWICLPRNLDEPTSLQMTKLPMFLKTLTRAQFQQACESFIHKQESLHPANEFTARSTRGWRWHQHSAAHRLGFMTRVGHILGPNTRAAPDCLLGDSNIEGLEGEDDSTLAEPQISSREALIVQQYVVYSPTFQVPVFYFTVHDRNGSPLHLKTIMKTSLFHTHVLPKSILAASHGISMPESNFPLLSQGDHPVLGSPCWYLHPCETAVAVSEILGAKGSDIQLSQDKALLCWIEAWFLVLCSVVDLR